MRPCVGCGTPVTRRGMVARCEPCRERHRNAERLRATRRSREDVSNDDLAVECWCRAEVVFVPVAEVQACRTRSCGAVNCREAV